MSPSSSTEKALAVVNDIRASIEKDDLDNQKARSTLLMKINDLRAAVETPTDAILRLYAQPMQNAALRLAVEMGLLRSLCDDVPLSCDSERGDGVPSLAYRVMRILAAMGIVTEVHEPYSKGVTAGEKTFRSTPIAKALTTPAFEGGVTFLFDSTIPTLAKLVPFLDFTKKVQRMAKNFECLNAPFDFAFGVPLFDHLKANPSLSSAFNNFMTGRRQGKVSWLDTYPVEDRLIKGAKDDTDSVFLVDVGGGQGHDLQSISDKFPTLSERLILQDTPEIIAEYSQLEPTGLQRGAKSGEKVLAGLKRSLSSLSLTKSTKVPFIALPHNFFNPQPVRGARVYHLRAILHDWPSPACRTILSHIANAMEPGYSKLIIRDFVLPEKNVPLFAACNDLLMMILHGGMERTETQLRVLLKSVGLVVTGVYVPEGWAEGVVEAIKMEKMTD